MIADVASSPELSPSSNLRGDAILDNERAFILQEQPTTDATFSQNGKPFNFAALDPTVKKHYVQMLFSQVKSQIDTMQSAQMAHQEEMREKLSPEAMEELRQKLNVQLQAHYNHLMQQVQNLTAPLDVLHTLMTAK